jgi:hypothetical protein
MTDAWYNTNVSKLRDDQWELILNKAEVYIEDPAEDADEVFAAGDALDMVMAEFSIVERE